MKNFQKKWSLMSPLERICTAVTIGCSAGVAVFSLLFLLDLAAFGITAAMGLMGITAVAQSILFWRRDKMVTFLMLLTAAFVFYVMFFMCFGG